VRNHDSLQLVHRILAETERSYGMNVKYLDQILIVAAMAAGFAAEAVEVVDDRSAFSGRMETLSRKTPVFLICFDRTLLDVLISSANQTGTTSSVRMPETGITAVEFLLGEAIILVPLSGIKETCPGLFF